MELNLDKIEETQQSFNEKYGVNFNIIEFNRQMRAMEDNFVGSQEDYDIHYKMNFTKLMRRAFDNFVDNRLKIDEFDPKKMLSDFEEMVMKPYRAECSAKSAISPSEEQWSDEKFYNRVNREFQDVPNEKWTYAVNRYMKGNLRVRDIRAYREQIDAEPGFPSEKVLSTLITYKCALEHGVNSRSRWFYIRHPFKSRAEIKELKEMKTLINRKIPGIFTPEEVEETRPYIEAEKIMNDKTIVKIKSSISNEVEKFKKANNERAKVAIENTDEVDQLNKGGRLSKPVRQQNKNKTINGPTNQK